MTDSKKVDFIEKISKSALGLEGLQIVVYCDKNRFGELSKEEKEQFEAYKNLELERIRHSEEILNSDRKEFEQYAI